MKIIDREEFIEIVNQRKGDGEITVDLFMDVLFSLFEEEKSIKYCDYPIIKTKLSHSKLDESISPRTKREDKIVVRINLKKKF